MTILAFPQRPAPLAPPPPPPLVLAPNDRILRMSAVTDRVGLSVATIYRRMNRGAFPSSVPLGGTIVGWRESEINAWIATRGQGGAK
ncbi:MAG: helix-turn-helix transcriptional regulator [Rhodanobacter sp.]